MDDTEESSDSLIAECKTKNKMYTNAQPEARVARSVAAQGHEQLAKVFRPKAGASGGP